MAGPDSIQSNSTSSAAYQQSPANSTDPVQEAADKIEKLIDSDGITQWASTEEVTEAANILARLDHQTADAVVDELAKRGILDDFAAEVVDGSWVGGGLSADNRATLFDNFAKQLDADSLVKVTDAFRQAGTPRDGEQYANELTQAINTHTQSSTRAEMVNILAERADGNNGTSTEALSQISADREQAAHILSELTGRSLDNAITTLDKNGTLSDVLQASVQTEYHFTPFGDLTHTTYNTDRFDTIMEHVANLSDAGTKKDAFAAGVEAMQAIDAEANPAVEVIRDATLPSYNDEAANEMALSLTKVLDSDVEGVMDEITYSGDTFEGEAMTAYAKQMLEAGATDQLGETLLKLQLGNNLNGDPTQRLEFITQNQNGNNIRPHLDALGHFIGAVKGGAYQINKDQAQQAEYATAVIKGALTALDKSKIGGPAVGTIASIAKEGVGLALKEAITNDNLNVANTWLTASFPIDQNSGRITIGSDTTGILTEKIDYISERAIE